MRIKFRVWFDNQMLFWCPDIAELDIRKPTHPPRQLDPRAYLNGDQKDVMLSTGVTDKNGKELYAGDIIRDGHINFIIKYGNTRVMDNEGYCDNNIIGFYLCQINDNYLWQMDRISEHEWIGNIYEDTILLNN